MSSLLCGLQGQLHGLPSELASQVQNNRPHFDLTIENSSNTEKIPDVGTSRS